MDKQAQFRSSDRTRDSQRESTSRWRSKLARYLTYALLATAQGDRKIEPQITYETKSEQSVDHADYNAVIYLSRLYDLESGYKKDRVMSNRTKELIRSNLNIPDDNYEVNADNIQRISNRIADLQSIAASDFSKSSIEHAATQVVEFTTLPDAISDEIELRTMLAQVDELADAMATAEQADFVKQAFASQAAEYMGEVQDGPITVQVDTFDDLQYLASRHSVFQADIEFKFSPNLTTINSDTLDQTIHNLNLMMENGGTSFWEHPIVMDYLNQLHFDSSEYPALVNDANLPIIIERAKQLNLYSIANDGQAIVLYEEFYPKRSIGLGDLYMNTTRWEHPRAVSPENTSAIVGDLAMLEKLIDEIYDDRPLWNTGLMEAYAASLDYSMLPQAFSPEALQEFQELDERYSDLVGGDRIVYYAIQPARQELYGSGRITAEQIPELHSRLQALLNDLEPEGFAYTMAIPRGTYMDNKVFPSRLRVAFGDVDDSNVVSMNQFMHDEVGRTLLTRALQSADDVRIVDIPRTVDADTFPIWEAMKGEFKELNGSVWVDFDKPEMFQPFYSTSIVDSRWNAPTSWEDVATLPDITIAERQIVDSTGSKTRDQSFMYGFYVLSQVDTSYLPKMVITEAALDNAYQTKIIPEPIVDRPELKVLVPETLDYRKLTHAITPETIDRISYNYRLINGTFNSEAAEAYLEELDFSRFPAQLDSNNYVDVASAIRWFENAAGQNFVQIYIRKIERSSELVFNAQTVVTLDNIEVEYAKTILARYELAEVIPADSITFDIKLSSPQNFLELIEAQKITDMMAKISQQDAKSFIEIFYASVDWSKATADVATTNIEDIERLRKTINQFASSSSGDQFLVNFGINKIERSSITPDNLEERVQFAEQFLQADAYVEDNQMHQDVLGMYQMIAQFQVTRILDYWSALDKDFDDADVAPFIARLQDAGADIPIEESSISKVLRSWSNPRYIAGKAFDRLSAGSALREEWRDIHTSMELQPSELGKGFNLYHLQIGDEMVARVVMGDPATGAKIDYVVQVGGGLTERVIKEMYGEKQLVAQMVAAYTTGASKPAELAIDSGVVRNYLLSNREGMVIISPDGTAKIQHRLNLVESDISPELPNVSIPFGKRLESFKRFIDISQQYNIDLMMGHLLLYQGELQVSDNSSTTPDKRRLFAIMNDGRFALIDFEPSITLLEAATILQQSGVRDAVNCDTGYYDHANYFTTDGERHQLGDQDKDGTNNVFTFYRE